MPGASLDVGLDGRVGVVWTTVDETEVPDVYFAESSDGGLSFPANVRITPSSYGIQQLPKVAYDGAGVAHLFWEEATDPSWDFNIFYAATGDGGGTLSPPERVNDDPPEPVNTQEKISAAGLPDGVVVVWMDSREDYEDNVYFAGPAAQSAGGGPGPGRRAGDLSAIGRIVPSVTRAGASFRGSGVTVLDLEGRIIWQRSLPGGREDWLHWNGRDRAGRRLAPGRYPVWIEGGGSGGARRGALLVVR